MGLHPAGGLGARRAFFNSFWRNLLAGTFHDQLPEDDWPEGGDRWFEVVRQIWDHQADLWWDDVTTPTREVRNDIVAEALLDARTEMTNRLAKDPQRWEWGRLHQLELEHQTFGTSGIGLIEMLFNRGPLRVGGGGSIVDATAWDAADGYEVIWVPSMRMVVDLADLDGSTWVNLTGQSGHPYDRTYTDQAELWRDGRQLAWPWPSGHGRRPRPPDPGARELAMITFAGGSPSCLGNSRGTSSREAGI